MSDQNGAGDVEITRMPLRADGWVGYADDAVFLDHDGERVKIHNDAIEQVGLRMFEWDIAIMSLLLIGVGGYVVLTRNPLVGAGFAAVGLFSLYRIYGRRWELVVHVENRPKPVTLHPEHPQECHETLVDRIGLQ